MTEPKSVLILGGTSDIGRAAAIAFARAGWRVTLAARDAETLSRDAADVATRTGREVATQPFDALDTASFAGLVDGPAALPDAVVSTVGLLGDQRRAETDLDHASLVMRTNFEGPALILGLFAERMVARGSGTIVGVSSVAGERGRASNYVYGAAKAGFTAFLSGLRNRCFKAGVHVVSVQPGFVRTKMTAHLELPGALTAEPDAVGAAILAAVEKKRDVVWVKGVWRWVMTIIRALPEPIFKRTKL